MLQQQKKFKKDKCYNKKTMKKSMVQLQKSRNTNATTAKNNKVNKCYDDKKKTKTNAPTQKKRRMTNFTTAKKLSKTNATTAEKHKGKCYNNKKWRQML